MKLKKLATVESRFADIIWANEPITTANLVKVCEKELNWKAEKGIDEMCADSYRWQSQNPNGYED